MTNKEWEKLILKTLRLLAQQRLTDVITNEKIWVISGGPTIDDQTYCAIQTAIMRGWVSVVHDNVPTGELLKPSLGLFKRGAIYGLTDSGWRVIHNEFRWIIVAAVCGIAGIGIAILPYLATLFKH